jgi:hypothetical protein
MLPADGPGLRYVPSRLRLLLTSPDCPAAITKHQEPT